MLQALNWLNLTNKNASRLVLQALTYLIYRNECLAPCAAGTNIEAKLSTVFGAIHLGLHLEALRDIGCGGAGNKQYILCLFLDVALHCVALLCVALLCSPLL